MQRTSSNILSLDVGERRIGVASASVIARIASPYKTLERTDKIVDALRACIAEKDASIIVVGLPRGLEGQETGQTMATRRFVEEITPQLPDVTFYFQDEALTSRKAEEELELRKKPYTKGDIDALSAAYILEDFLIDNQGRELKGTL